jgi:hypothetical protein
VNAFRPDSLIKCIKAESLRVHAPTVVVFLCGGAMVDKQRPPTALRDVFYRNIHGTAQSYSVILAEGAKPLEADAGYTDLFQFESDIAQIVGLILLFAESAGSLAELGAFAALQTVSPRLLAVLDDHYYNEVSFIRNGPVKYLENRHGEEWITVLERDDVGIADDGAITNINPAALTASIMPAINKRLAANPRWIKFDRHNAGHIILLMTGLCQEYGALTITEIKSHLTMLGVEEPRLTNFTYCAELLGWLKKVRKGHHIFYVATGGDHAIDYSIESDGKPHDKVRWRSDVRAHWAANDRPRLRAIADVVPAPRALP